MKGIFVIIFLVYSCSLIGQDDLYGTWLLETSNSSNSLFLDHSIWIKFKEGNVIISNSSDKFIFRRASIWNYSKGEFTQTADTIYFDIQEDGNISTNTGRSVDLSRFLDEDILTPDQVIFIVQERNDKYLELVRISGEERIQKFYGMLLNEVYRFKKTEDAYFWDNKI